MTPYTANNPTERHLTEADITRLRQQGCTASDWSQVTLHPDTDLNYIAHVNFFGRNYLGRFDKVHELTGGILRHSGVYRCTLCDTTIGNDCLIEDVHCLSRYDVAEECLLRHTDTVVTEGEATFGQGTEIAVLSETGGREIIMHSHLSAQEAYMQAMYRHDTTLISALRGLALREAVSHKSLRGTIEKGSCIIRCGFLRNIFFGEACRIEGAAHLDNGTVCSHHQAPTHVGEQVIAKDFILQTGCEVTDGAMLTRCYVGQASVIGHGFSASDTYFACNCQAENGEACAVFAGPYTVTHHKSTLLIGGMFSFMNAGSGTNQSNHMYKLGPSHQGVLERGSKTASDSHILWPARVGAFSMVMGHYKAHADTGLFPFSYLVEQQERNILIPGIALRNVGTRRDIQKWPQRDRRSTSVPTTDHIVFEAYSPYTIGKMLQAIPLLQQWGVLNEDNASSTTEWQGMLLKKSSIVKGEQLYRMAVARFYGEQLLQRLAGHEDTPSDTLYTLLEPTVGYSENWYDLCGLIAPQGEIERLAEDIKSGIITSADELHARTLYIYKQYEAYTWAWTWHKIMEQYPHADADSFTREVCLPVLREWATAAYRLNELTIADAEKEFDSSARTGFGIDGDRNMADLDFLAVRGCPETHPVIQELRREQEEIQRTAARWTSILTR